MVIHTMKRILIIFGLLTFAIGGQTQVSYEDDADAREARCNARRMNNPALAAALANIEADLAEAEQAASELGNADAKTAVEDAKAAANQKAEETKAAAKQKANEAVDNAAQNVKKGLGL